MLILSHRGQQVSAPENTLAAFKEVARRGVDGIETDVRLSADGRLVLYHDRTSPAARDVVTLTRDELSAELGYEVPTLDEALDALPGLFWVLELKTPETVDPVVDVLHPRLDDVRCLVISFWHKIVADIRSRLNVDCGVLLGHCPIDLEHSVCASLRDLGIGTIVWDFEFLDPRLVNEASARGLRNLAYNHDPVHDDHRFEGLGLDGIITRRT